MADTAEQHQAEQQADPGNKLTIACYILLVQRFIYSLAEGLMLAVLDLYMQNKLQFSMEEAASLINGRFMMITFFMPLGAIFASSLFSRYAILIIASMLLATGQFVLFIGSMPAHRNRFFLYISWIIGSTGAFIGSGIYHACSGDQFKLPEQQSQLRKFYGKVYFLHNVSILLAFLIGPLLRTHVACFGEQDCYSISSGIAATLYFLGIILYLVSAKHFVKNTPAYGIMINFWGCIGYALKKWVLERKTNPRPNWLDHAEPQYGAQLVGDIKRFFQMLTVLVTFPIFFVVYDQVYSKWSFQATRMDGRISGTSFTVTLDHYRLLNPFLAIVLMPLVTMVFDPITDRWGFKRLLRRIILGWGLIAFSFLLAGVLESYLKQTYPKTLQSDESELRIFNGLNCSYIMQATDIGIIEMYPLGVFTKKHIPVSDQKSMQLSSGDDCAIFSVYINLEGGKAISVFVQQIDDNTIGVTSYEEIVKKSETGSPVISVLGLHASDSLAIVDSKKVYIKIKSDGNDIPRSTKVMPETYTMMLNGRKIGSGLPMHLGGIYVVSIIGNDSISLYEVVEPNSVHILWMCPQSIILALGEVYYKIAALSFLYGEAPMSLKQVAFAIHMFGDGMGEDVIALMNILETLEQDYRYYLSALIMILDMVLLFFIALRFKPLDASTKVI